MNINTLITQKKIRPTTARMHILEILNLATKPMSYEDFKDNLPMDKATFYRSITKFEEEGLLNSFESNDKKRYFELKDNPHAHFVCTQCNDIECMNNINILINDYEISNITINGKCKKCLNQDAK